MVNPVSPLCLDSTCWDGGAPCYKLASKVRVISPPPKVSCKRRPCKKRQVKSLLRRVLVKNARAVAAQTAVRRPPPPPPSTPPPDDLEEETNDVNENNQVSTEDKVEQVFFAIAPCTIL